MEIKRFSGFIPTQYLRERFSEVSHLLAGNTPIQSQSVLDFYLSLERSEGRMPDNATIERIRYHRHFYATNMTVDELERVEWYFSPDPKHISYQFTKGGHDRALFSVAQMYIKGEFDLENIYPWKQDAVENILKRYKAGESLPQVILSERPKGMRPDGKLHVIDGVHRLLALAAYQLENGLSNQVYQAGLIA